MKKSIKLTALLLIFVFLLSGCNLFEVDESDKLPIMFEYNTEYDVLRNGRLTYEITGFRVIYNIANLPEAGGIRDDGFVYTVVCLDDRDEAIEYPELVQSDGSFANDTYMVLVEMTVTSENAEMWTSKDLNEYGKPAGSYDDPYLFSIEWSCDLYTRSRKAAAKMIAYFSELNQNLGNWYNFRLLPGEAKAVTVGFFVSEERATQAPYDISDLCLRIQTSPGQYEYIPILEHMTE